MFTCGDPPWRSGVFSGLCSYSFLRCSSCLRCGSLGFPSALAGSLFGFVGSAPAYALLSGTSMAPSVLLSQCLVRVLLSLCSWFVAPVAPSAVAPVPEVFAPQICLPPLTLVSALYFYGYLVAILMLAAGSSLAPLPPCSFRGVLPAPSAPSRHVFLSSVEPGHSTLGGFRSQGLIVR